MKLGTCQACKQWAELQDLLCRGCIKIRDASTRRRKEELMKRIKHNREVRRANMKVTNAHEEGMLPKRLDVNHFNKVFLRKRGKAKPRGCRVDMDRKLNPINESNSKIRKEFSYFTTHNLQ